MSENACPTTHRDPAIAGHQRSAERPQGLSLALYAWPRSATFRARCPTSCAFLLSRWAWPVTRGRSAASGDQSRLIRVAENAVGPWRGPCTSAQPWLVDNDALGSAARCRASADRVEQESQADLNRFESVGRHLSRWCGARRPAPMKRWVLNYPNPRRLVHACPGTGASLEERTVAVAACGGTARSRFHYWVATANRDGRPQARPLDGVVVDATLYFNGGDVRWVKDLRENRRISVHLGAHPT